MNVFEDLVVELQKENLLETTVMCENGDETNAFDETEVPNRTDFPEKEDVETEDESDELSGDELSEKVLANAIHETDEPVKSDNKPAPQKNGSGREFFKKKAIGEVSSLQMVEHVITSIEREYMKIVPRTFDDFSAKKALNTFTNSDDSVDSEEHAAAEFALMRETEAWCSALAERDREVPVFAFRQYCERTRPALSSQAVLSLGRFYRNLPYSENVRSKFDFVITRLFSRSIGQQKRACLFNREEMLVHLNTLYKEWSSVPLYDADDDESNVTLTALSFEDLAIEAERASVFDELIESDFFGRLKMFKESISELFYAPQVTVAAILANIRIGNRYVDLIDSERQKLDAESLRAKYGNLNDSAVSDMTGKSLELADLLRTFAGTPAKEKGNVESEDAPAPRPAVKRSRPSPTIHRSNEPKRTESKKDRVIEADPALSIQDTLSSFLTRLKTNAFAVNKGVLIFAAVMITASVALYIWANTGGDQISTTGVSRVEIKNTAVKPFVKNAKTSGPNFYAIMEPTWDKLPKEKRVELLQQLYQIARENGSTQVTLLGAEGSSVGFASATRMDLPNQ